MNIVKKWSLINLTLQLFLPLSDIYLYIMFWFGELKGCPEFLFKYIYAPNLSVYLDDQVPLCLQSVLDIAQIRLSVDKRRNYMI